MQRQGTLLEGNLRQVLKERDAWITVVLFDLLAMIIIRLLARMPISVRPTEISFLSVIFFFWAMLALNLGFQTSAAMLVVLSVTMDCVDGKWARLTGSQSNMGRLVDAGGDLVTHSVGFSLLAYWLYGSSQTFATVFVLGLSLVLSRIHLKELLHTVDAGSHNVESQDYAPGIKASIRRFLSSNRLSLRPISEVEFAFILPVLLILSPQYANFIVALFVAGYFLSHLFRKWVLSS